MKYKIFALGFFSISAVLLVFYFLTKSKKQETTTPAALPPEKVQSVVVLDKNKNLYLGVNAQGEIRELQRQLIIIAPIGTQLNINGVFDEKTKNALYALTGKQEITLNQFQTKTGAIVADSAIIYI